MYDYPLLEERLGSLLSSDAGHLTADEKREVRDFIEVGEYGLAYETLCDIITEGNKTISSDTYDRLAALGRRMEFAEDVWSRLRPHVKD